MIVFPLLSQFPARLGRKEEGAPEAGNGLRRPTLTTTHVIALYRVLLVGHG